MTAQLVALLMSVPLASIHHICLMEVQVPPVEVMECFTLRERACCSWINLSCTCVVDGHSWTCEGEPEEGWNAQIPFMDPKPASDRIAALLPMGLSDHCVCRYRAGECVESPPYGCELSEALTSEVVWYWIPASTGPCWQANP